MSKNTLLVIIALAIVAGGLFYLKSRPQGPASDISINSDQSMSEVATEAQKFAAAVESGEPYTCTLTQDDTTMTYQLMGEKMFMTIATPTSTNYAIKDGTYLYSWSNQADQGSKFKLSTKEELAAKASDSPEPSEVPTFTEEDYDAYQQQGYSITCTKDSFGSEVFTPPTNITFIDPTAMMQDAMGEDGTPSMEELEQMAKEYEGMMPEGN